MSKRAEARVQTFVGSVVKAGIASVVGKIGAVVEELDLSLGAKSLEMFQTWSCCRGIGSGAGAEALFLVHSAVPVVCRIRA